MTNNTDTMTPQERLARGRVVASAALDCIDADPEQLVAELRKEFEASEIPVTQDTVRAAILTAASITSYARERPVKHLMQAMNPDSMTFSDIIMAGLYFLADEDGNVIPSPSDPA